MLLTKIKNKIKGKSFKNILYMFVNYIFKILNNLIIHFFYIFPIKSNYIILESEGDYTDNIRVFYDFLIKNEYNKTYKLIWFVHDPKKYKKENNVIFLNRFNLGIHFKSDFYIAVSRFFIFSHPHWLKKWRKNQTVIHTTHSAYQLKKDTSEPIKVADYVLVCSDFVGEKRYKGFMLKPENMLTIGMPRIDLLFNHKDCITKLIPNYNNEKIILSMTTMKKALNWNDSSVETDYCLNIVNNESELYNLDNFLHENNFYLIIKIHHLQDLSVLKTFKCKNILYLKDDILQNYDIQVNELLENADILLTDYSSVFYEYLFLNRPIGFLIGDIDNYTRGFESSTPLEEMPGEKISNIDYFKLFVKNILLGEDNFGTQRELMKNKIFKYQDNNNSQRLIEWINKHNKDK